MLYLDSLVSSEEDTLGIFSADFGTRQQACRNTYSRMEEYKYKVRVENYPEQWIAYQTGGKKIQ